MKTIQILLIAILLYSCEKEPKQRVNYDGTYSGVLTYTLDGKVITMDATRTISENKSIWWVVPECHSDFNPVSKEYQIHAVWSDSSSNCNQHWTYEFTGTGIIRNDSLIELGTIRNVNYSDGKVYKVKTGVFYGRFGKI